MSEQAPDYVTLRDELRVGAHVRHKTRDLAGIVFSVRNGAAMVAIDGTHYHHFASYPVGEWELYVDERSR